MTILTTVLLSTYMTMAFTPNDGEVRFLEAVEAQKQGRYADAYERFDMVREDTEHLRGYAILEMAACRAAMGNTADAMTLYKALFEDTPSSPWGLLARVRMAKLLKAQGRYLEAAPHYKAILEIRPQPWWMYTYAWDAVDDLLQHESTERDGYDWYQHRVETVGYIQPRLDAARELIKSPWSEHQAAALLGMIRSSAFDDVAEFFEKEGLDIFLREKQLSPIDLQQLILQISASPDADPEALAAQLNVDVENPWVIVWLLHFAHQRLEAEDYEHATTIADFIARIYPEQRDAGDLYWHIAQALEQEGKEKAAEAMYLRLTERAPSHFRVKNVLYELGMNYLEQNQVDEAEQYFQHMQATFPHNRWQGEAFYKLAGKKFEAGEEVTAWRYMEVASEGPLANYYTHRALARLHEHDPAQHPAVRNLRISNNQPVLMPKADLTQQHTPLPAEMEARSDVRRLRFFGYYGLPFGEWEAIHLCQQLEHYHDPGPWYQLIAEAGFAHTALDFATAHGWGTEDGEPTPERLRLEFPRAYWNKMLIIADEVGLDPYLFLAIAKQESTFRASIQSHAGAVGVMQLMPSTANWMIEVESAITASHVANLESPRNSIRLGGYYLRRMVNRSNGNLIDALAAYNGGPGNLDRWRSRFSGYSLDEFVEAIPFSETRNYVKKVLGNYAAYHSLYPQVEPPQELARLNDMEEVALEGS